MLHGTWLPAHGAGSGAFVLWAESAFGYVRAARRRATAMPDTSDAVRPRSHPFTVKLAALSDAVRVGGVQSNEVTTTRLVARLPCLDGLTLPSPGLSAEDAVLAPAGVALAPWRVDGLGIDIALAMELLPRLAAEHDSPHVVPGDDLGYWLAMRRFALDLMLRQRFLPTLDRQGRRLVARWRPLLDEWDDAQRFGALLKAMPPICRAMTARAGDPVPEPRALGRSFLDAAVDTVARPAAASVRKRGYHYELADAWLDALAGDPIIKSSLYWQTEPSYQQYRAWMASIDAMLSLEEPFRLCLRLRPPDVGADPRWTLDYMLQATDDPSLLVDATEVWRQRGATARFLDRKFKHPRQLLLVALGRAGKLFAPIEASLRGPEPSGCALTTAEAYEFLKVRALTLRAHGFGVLLPAGMDAKLGLRLRLGGGRRETGRVDGPAMFGADALVQFDWQVALGGETLSREEFEALAALKEPLVQVRGLWVELRSEMVEQALGFLRRQSRGELTMQEALRLALAPEDQGLPVEEVATEGWFADVLKRLGDGLAREEVEEPEGFVGQLRHYQKTGVSWLATLRRYGLGACLADDMGLGKTIEVIALLLHQRPAVGVPAPARRGPTRGPRGGESTGSPPYKRGCDAPISEEAHAPSLLICPTSVVGNWRHELARFAPSLRVLVHHGAGRTKEAFAEQAMAHDLVISSYALLHRDEAALASVQWRDVILDEAQNIKNASTKAAQTARRLPSRWRAALTGTPVENRLSDLWSIFQFLNPGYLGSADDFRQRLAGPIEREQDQAAGARLKALVSPFILRRVKTDRAIIADLPEKNEMKVYCTLTKEQATLYEAIVREALRDIGEAEGLERRGRILAGLTKLKQVCDHPALFLHDNSRLPGRSGKLTRLTEMLEEVLAVGDRALVFTQFAEMGDQLRRHLAHELRQEPLFLHGATPAQKRDEMVARFQSGDGGPQVFVLSIRAGGTGLNLTGANHVFHFDRWWNPAVENQATDRAFRIGQRRDVQVHKFLCAGTLEEKIDEVIERKLALSEAIVGANEAWITELSTDQLRDLFTLRRDAVEE